MSNSKCSVHFINIQGLKGLFLSVVALTGRQLLQQIHNFYDVLSTYVVPVVQIVPPSLL